MSATGTWKKSSFSANNGTCVEVAQVAERFAARDSKQPGGPVLSFPSTSFHHLLRAVS